MSRRALLCENPRPAAERAGGRPRLIIPRPACPACGHPKAAGWGVCRVRGRHRSFKCNRCYNRRRKLRECPEAAAALLKQIDAALPGNLWAEEREDARQAAFAAVLAGRLSPERITRESLRPFTRDARGMGRDGYRFVSLSAPLGDGLTFGDTLRG